MDSCKYCNRRFAVDRLQLHEDICSKTSKKKRKTYDATKHRVQGTELEPFARKAVGKTSSKAVSKTRVYRTYLIRLCSELKALAEHHQVGLAS